MRLGKAIILAILLLPFCTRAETSFDSTNAGYRVENLFSIDYARTIGKDILHVTSAPFRWKEPQWERLSVCASAIIGAVAVSDLEMRAFVRRNRSRFVDDLMTQIEPFGRHYPFAVSSTFYLAGVIFKKPNARATGLDGFAASLVASEMITPALKKIIGRKRPFRNEGEFAFDSFSPHVSFPSGHTTRAFAVAAVIDAHYRQKWVKITAYTIATLVACSRMNSDMHWSSDVIAGGIIGITVGKAIVKLNRERRARR